MEIKTLKKFGLSEKESRLYMTGLKHEKFTVSEISQEAGIKRPTCYVILEELRKKGLAFIIPRSKGRYYALEHPRVMLNDLENKLHQMEKIVPELERMMVEKNKAPELRMFSGVKGMQRIFEEMLETKEKKIYSIVATAGMLKTLGSEYSHFWVNERAKRKIFSESIRVKGEEIEDEQYIDTKLFRKIYYLKQNIELPYTIHMYDDNTAFLSDEKETLGFVIQSKKFQQTIQSLYELIRTSSVAS